MPEDDSPYNLCCGIDETKLELLMYKDDDLNLTVEYPLAEYFEKDCRGGWVLKVYVPKCEFCGDRDCDRMEEREDLEDMIEDLRLDATMQNNQKRFKMYREWIHFKHGSLGKGERREVDECVGMLIVSNFPPPEGTDLTGFSEE